MSQFKSHMKIALVHEMITKLGGAERVLKSLSNLYPDAPIYTLFHEPEKSKQWFGDKQIHTSNLQTAYRLLPSPKPLLPFMAKAVESWDFSKYDVVISSSSAFAHGIKTGPKTKHITYCHSPMRYSWDYTHQYSKNYPRYIQWSIANILNPIRQWDYLSAGRPDIIIANSEHVKKRVQKYWRREAQVIYPPVNIKRFTPKSHHEDYFLIISALTPFKRIDLAIKTFNKIKRKLVIIGDGAQRKYLQSIADKNIEFLGYKDDHVTRDYLEHCRAFIFPGEEDFGITPVEAMAAGKPVLAYGVGGVTESVVGGISGEFFHEPTTESLEDGLARLLANEKHYDSKKIREIAERFDENIFLDEIKKIANNKNKRG